jgi:hypothetical protein
VGGAWAPPDACLRRSEARLAAVRRRDPGARRAVGQEGPVAHEKERRLLVGGGPSRRLGAQARFAYRRRGHRRRGLHRARRRDSARASRAVGPGLRQAAPGRGGIHPERGHHERQPASESFGTGPAVRRGARRGDSGRGEGCARIFTASSPTRRSNAISPSPGASATRPLLAITSASHATPRLSTVHSGSKPMRCPGASSGALSRERRSARDLSKEIARLCSCSRVRPMLSGFNSEEAQCAAGDEVTLEVEGVVDG